MNTLAELLSSKVKAEVLRLLFVTVGQELHVREIARRADLSEATVRQELTRLAGLGVVASRRAGNRIYYSANADHPLYADIRSLVLKTSGLIEVLRARLDHPKIQIAFVFGSIAAGTDGASSDVDLMVIGSIGMRELSGLLAGAQEILGREVNPHILTPKEYVERRKKGDHFLTEVVGSRKLFAIGAGDELEAMGR